MPEDLPIPEERSESGAQIYRHPAPDKRDWTVPNFALDNLEAITKHIEEHIGPVATVFHELVSELVHIDIHVVAPTADRPYFSLITSGMSDIPMISPKGAEKARFAELMLCLPADWPMSQEDWKKPENYWPIRALKSLARFPHDHKTWLWWGHTIPNENPPIPFATNTGTCCIMLAQPLTVSTRFSVLKLNEEKSIAFFSLLPLFADELDLKLKKGAEEIIKRFEKAKYSELIDLSRKSVAANPWWRLC